MERFDTLIDNVVGWAADKNILKPENAAKQMLKVMEEVGETAGALAKNKQEELKDGIGDAFVTLIILAKQVGMEPADCLEAAWNEIKNRTGKTVNGVFIKDQYMNNNYLPIEDLYVKRIIKRAVRRLRSKGIRLILRQSKESALNIDSL